MDPCNVCGLPLEDCTTQEHWEQRLKAVNLGLRRGQAARMRTPDGDWQEKLAPLTGKHSEKRGAPLVLPQDPGVTELFVADSCRVRLSPQEPRRFWPNAQDTNPSVRHRVTC